MEADKTKNPDGVTVEKTVVETSKQPSNKERFNQLMTERIKGYNPDDEESAYGLLMDAYNSNEEQKNRLAEALQEDPRLASLLADIVSKKRTAPGALARYFGKDFLSAEEGSPEYEEIMQAEEERKKETEIASKNAKEYQDNLQKSIPVIEEFCKGKGYPVEDFMDKIWELVISPIQHGIYTRELCEMLDKGFNYDSDVQDAMAAGEVKGRNTNINKMRNEEGDGMPKGISDNNFQNSGKRKGKSIIDYAREA